MLLIACLIQDKDTVLAVHNGSPVTAPPYMFDLVDMTDDREDVRDSTDDDCV